ncbi:Hypothetical predicted protein [Mytilus galloprovincialis]|uniref:Short-chain collagen C4-like n=1 Tax=Mytilus galloprovincialis TaxID=29158 RepID=A0A8B6F3U2_MYTGA|nr:Hypothetical predicted protein [Mytilus galloprovincialis]
MSNLTVLCLLWIVQFQLTNTVNEVQHKRLLLNDPDVINSRLINLEKSMQDVVRLTQQQQIMQSTIAQLQTQNTNMQSTMAQLETKNTNMQSTITHLQTELTQEKEKVSLLSDRGSTYIRWGRKQCSGLHTEIMYTGFASGQDYHRSNYYGGPANMLCLPNNPELNNRTGTSYSFLSGTEYENGNFFVNGAANEDVPCALCRSVNTSTSIMIPGRESCDSGWKLEYHGILASGHYGNKPSSYICLDSHPEFLQAGEDDKNGHLLYATQTNCGSLACPPYVNNKAINCVVCSR